jgi:hypothetical protein
MRSHERVEQEICVMASETERIIIAERWECFLVKVFENMHYVGTVRSVAIRAVDPLHCILKVCLQASAGNRTVRAICSYRVE